jgi:hypothetical protein
MAEYTGTNLYLAWVHSGGTAVLSTDYRSLADAPAVDLVDISAGNDTYRTYLTALKDGQYTYSGLHQTSGTVLKAALQRGTSGTLILGPEGTVAGKPKETIPAISLGAQMNYTYNDVTEISVTFQQNGAETPGTY